MKGIISAILSLTLISSLTAQAPKKPNTSDIYLGLKKLNVLGTVLYVAAHPDDENTRLISYLANEDLVQTAYFSCTRGDGGQNLIGPEIREGLGLIRTQELLAARRIDGGQQFFSRANDFGFSKHPDETFTIWDKEQVLADLVWVIRKFKPDVIITRFSHERAGRTHGHHTSSAILAHEAFDIAGDPNAYPEQLEWVQPWQPKRLFWNTSSFFFRRNESFDKSGLLQIDAGAYNPQLGESYPELAARSRSQHKSQGFGSTGARGQSIEYLDFQKGEPTSSTMYEGVDLTWNRVAGGSAIAPMISRLIEDFDFNNPSASVAGLIELRKIILQLEDSHYKNVKLQEVDRLIKASAGLYLEVVAADYSAVPGESLIATIEATNRSRTAMSIKNLTFSSLGKDSTLNTQLPFNQRLRFQTAIKIPDDAKPYQPYWLEEKGSLGMFKVDNQSLRGLPENKPAIVADFTMDISGQEITYTLPLVYKRTDPVKGETYRPFVITPDIFVNLKSDVYIFPSRDMKEITVTVKAGRDNVAGAVDLILPEGWKSEPKSFDISINSKEEEQDFVFQVFPPKKQSVGDVQARVRMGNQTYDKSLQLIQYDHIPTQTIFPRAKARVVKLDIQKSGEKIGYITGAGDKIPESLEQIGYEVDLLTSNKLKLEELKKYDAIILGIRAYNTVADLKFSNKNLLSYVEEGGTLIVQYNTSFRLVLNDFAPYPLRLSRDRVIVERAKVELLAKDHPVLNYPNKITEKDFQDWVQERGLYFPSEWDSHYTAVLSSNDPGESPKNGGLLVTKYGKGHYIYTGYSWFRQLPAGVPGAYRLFTNLVSLGK